MIKVCIWSGRPGELTRTFHVFKSKQAEQRFLDRAFNAGLNGRTVWSAHSEELVKE